jgi:hypothetical protein
MPADNVPLSLPQFLTVTVLDVPGYIEIDTLDELEGCCLLTSVICRQGSGGCTISVTVIFTWAIPEPVEMVKVIVSLYWPAERPEVETLTVTFCVAPALRALLNGLVPSQPEPLAVEADQEPRGPQLVSVIV